MTRQPSISPNSSGHGARRRRLIPATLGITAALAVTSAGIATAASPQPSDRTPAQATGGVTAKADAAPSGTAAKAAKRTDTITPDPSYQGLAFEGWGTSLVWFANATGGYPDEIKERLADLVFGEDGLNLNIARYNIGGGNAPEVKDYLRPGGAVPGWWKAPKGTTRTDTDWFDADDDSDYDFDADANQRWWVDRVKDRVTKWETFSNSPPWFMTKSGYVSGGLDSEKDQLKTGSIDDFTTYLTKVTKHLEKSHGINVDTIDPFNEPNTDYWGTELDDDGEPTGGRQEGAHMSPKLQDKVISSLSDTLKKQRSKTGISGPDETNPSTFLKDVDGWSDSSLDAVDRLNVHTYGTDQRTAARDLSKSTDKPLWMSEVEGSSGDGQSFTDMTPGLGMASQIGDDLRELEPSAWVFWQPVEDYDNMKPGGESEEGANWGSIQLPFDCDSSDDLSSCPIRTNQKFNTVRNFTHYIRPGDHLVQTGNENATAAVRSSKSSASVVYTNSAASKKSVTVDLSKFGHVRHGATVTPVVTSSEGALKKGEPVKVAGDSATVKVPAKSVTTLLVSGVNGSDRDASAVKPEHTYKLTGVQSHKAATVSSDGGSVSIEKPDSQSATQLFTFKKVARGSSTARDRYEIRAAGTRQRLASRDGELVLEKTSFRRDPAAQWYLSTTGSGKFSISNAASAVNVEVDGEKTSAGSAVGLGTPDSGKNQSWTVKDRTVSSVPSVSLSTTPHVAPKLPSSVSVKYADGSSGSLPVAWRERSDRVFRAGATVRVWGTTTDALGKRHHVTAVVSVSK